MMKKLTLITCLLSLLFNVSACGTILHPERKGQRDGRIDAGVAVLDGIGLLFFIIPGVIAYAVDFSNGTIYLPGGKRAALENPEDLADIYAVNLGKENLSAKDIQKAIYAKTGKIVDVDTAKTMPLNAEQKAALHTQAAAM